MDIFSEVTRRCAGFMINALNEASRINLGDGNDSSTLFVKNAQALELGKIVIAVGLFSIFEARLQEGLACADGFPTLRNFLLNATEDALATRFEQFVAAVNVLNTAKQELRMVALSERGPPFNS
jgi:hypothetical protein